jgi:hypothetical protein
VGAVLADAVAAQPSAYALRVLGQRPQHELEDGGGVRSGSASSAFCAEATILTA